MGKQEFDDILMRVIKNALSEEDLSLISTTAFDQEEAALLLNALLLNTKHYRDKGILINSNLNLEELRSSYYQPINHKILSAFKDLNQKIITYKKNKELARFPPIQVIWALVNILFLGLPFLISKLWKQIVTGAKTVEKSLGEIADEHIEKLHKTMENSSIETKLISDSLFADATMKNKDRDAHYIYNFIDQFEKILEKTPPDTEIKKIKDKLIDYTKKPKIETLSSIRTDLENYIKTNQPNDPVFQNALLWASIYQPYDLIVRKNTISPLYLGILAKNERLLASPDIDKSKKYFLEVLQRDLHDYGSRPNKVTLKKIKAAVDEEIKKIQDPNYTLTDEESITHSDRRFYLNPLSIVSGWAIAEETRYTTNHFQERATIYSALEKNATLLLPLRQGVDTNAGEGECFGYVARWAKGILLGEGKKSVFGIKPKEEPLFKLAKYDKLGRTMPELNHLFPTTQDINTLHHQQQDEAMLSHTLSSETEKIRFAKNQSHFMKANDFIEKLIAEIKTNGGHNQTVFQISMFNDKSAHALGLWRSAEGQYHLFDANFGWFRSANKDAFKAWAQTFFSKTGYDEKYSEFRVNTFSLVEKDFVDKSGASIKSGITPPKSSGSQKEEERKPRYKIDALVDKIPPKTYPHLSSLTQKPAASEPDNATPVSENDTIKP